MMSAKIGIGILGFLPHDADSCLKPCVSGVEDWVDKPFSIRKRVTIMTQALIQREKKHTVDANYNNCQKYVPIDLALLSRVIASEV